MKWRRSDKFLMPAVAVVLALVTWASVTAWVGPPQKRRRAAGPAAPAAGMHQVITTGEGEAPADVLPAGPVVPWEQSMRSSPLSVKVMGRQVAVAGSAEVTDQTSSHLVYVWLLRVHAYGREDKLLWEHHYLDRPATLPEGETVGRPSFADVITLDPGKYHVKLILYAVPADFRFRSIERGEDMGVRAFGGQTARSEVVVVE